MFISYREIGVIYCLWNLKESLFSLFISTVVAHFLTVQLHLFNQFSCSCLSGPRWQWMVWNGGNGQPGVHVPASTACSEGGSCSSSLMQFFPRTWGWSQMQDSWRVSCTAKGSYRYNGYQGSPPVTWGMLAREGVTKQTNPTENPP